MQAKQIQSIQRKSNQNGFKSNELNTNQAVSIDWKEIQAYWLQIKRNQDKPNNFNRLKGSPSKMASNQRNSIQTKQFQSIETAWFGLNSFDLRPFCWDFLSVDWNCLVCLDCVWFEASMPGFPFNLLKLLGLYWARLIWSHFD